GGASRRSEAGIDGRSCGGRESRGAPQRSHAHRTAPGRRGAVLPKKGLEKKAPERAEEPNIGVVEPQLGDQDKGASPWIQRETHSLGWKHAGKHNGSSSSRRFNPLTPEKEIQQDQGILPGKIPRPSWPPSSRWPEPAGGPEESNGTKSPNHISSLLPLEGPGVVQSGLKEELMDLKETDVRLQAAKQRLTHSAHQSTAWQILQEESRNIGGLSEEGDRKENRVKVEDFQGGEDAEEICGQDTAICPENLPWKKKAVYPISRDGGHLWKWRLRNALEKDLTTAVPEKTNKGKVSMFSQYDRRYLYQAELNPIPSTEKLDQCPQRFEDSYQHTSNVTREEKGVVSEKRVEIAENGTGNNANVYLSNSLRETHNNSP
ncbi:hypothetical protein E2320_014470, partial [Naja naja]